MATEQTIGVGADDLSRQSPIAEKTPYGPGEELSSVNDNDGALDTLKYSVESANQRKLPLGWQIAMETHINNSQFATLVAITNLVNTFLCVGFGFCIDRWGGAPLSVILAGFHLSGAMVMAGAATNNLNSYGLLIVGKVLAAVGDGSLDNAQHRIFSTYFAPGRGFAFSIGAIWGIANLAQFTGQSTANVISTRLGSYAWALWISAAIALFSFLCAVGVVVLDRYLRARYVIMDHTTGGATRGAAATRLFENAGVQAFVSISTQFAQQRLKKGAVVGGWVSSFYLLLPACLTPFLGIYIDVFGQRIGFLFVSSIAFLVSMLLLKFSYTVPSFVAAYVFYALAQSVTPAPQVEIIRSIIPNPENFATGYEQSVVQASIVIITTAAGKLQDDTRDDSLGPAVSLWLAYAFIAVAIAGTLLALSYLAPAALPAARLSQIAPRKLGAEVARLCALTGTVCEEKEKEKGAEDAKRAERMLKAPEAEWEWVRWVSAGVAVVIVVIAWIVFGLGVAWGVHGSVIAGTVGD
ncbi:MFS general substrate transporter [Amylocystis lapponica]|nr:MFS general substrate transporter [Amylocystis lapponica]